MNSSKKLLKEYIEDLAKEYLKYFDKKILKRCNQIIKRQPKIPT